MSPYQATGGDQAARLCQELKNRGYKVWYDNDMENLTAEGGARHGRCSHLDGPHCILFVYMY
jgi:hypothetical protein